MSCQLWHSWQHQCDRWPGEEAGHPVEWSGHQHDQVLFHLLCADIWREWKSHHHRARTEGKLVCNAVRIHFYLGAKTKQGICNSNVSETNIWGSFGPVCRLKRDHLDLPVWVNGNVCFQIFSWWDLISYNRFTWKTFQNNCYSNLLSNQHLDQPCNTVTIWHSSRLPVETFSSTIWILGLIQCVLLSNTGDVILVRYFSHSPFLSRANTLCALTLWTVPPTLTVSSPSEPSLPSTERY